MIANRVEPQRLAGASLLNRGPEHLNRANNEPVVCLMTRTIDGVNNLREIRVLLVPDGVHTAPNALALALGAPADRDLTHLTCSNTKTQMRANAQSHHNLAGICCARGAIGSIRRKHGVQRAMVSRERSYSAQARASRIASAMAEPAEPAEHDMTKPSARD